MLYARIKILSLLSYNILNTFPIVTQFIKISRRYYTYRKAINFKKFVTIRRVHLEYNRGKISSLGRRDLISIVASAAYVFHKSQFLVAWRVYYESRGKLRNGLPCLALIIRPTRAWNRDKGIISICRGTSKTETSDNECRKVGIWFRAPLTRQPLAHMEGWGLMVAERPWTHPSPGPTIPPLTILPFSLFPALPASSSTPSATLPPLSIEDRGGQPWNSIWRALKTFRGWIFIDGYFY